MMTPKERTAHYSQLDDDELAHSLRVCLSLLLDRRYLINATMRSGSSQPVLGPDDIIIKKCTFL